MPWHLLELHCNTLNWIILSLLQALLGVVKYRYKPSALFQNLCDSNTGHGMERKFRHGMENFKNGMEGNLPYFHTNSILDLQKNIYRCWVMTNNIVTEVFIFIIYGYYLSTNCGSLVVYITQTMYVMHHSKYQRWSPRGHILKSLASKPQVLENCPCPQLEDSTILEPLKFCWKMPETLWKITKDLFLGFFK